MKVQSYLLPGLSSRTKIILWNTGTAHGGFPHPVWVPQQVHFTQSKIYISHLKLKAENAIIFTYEI